MLNTNIEWIHIPSGIANIGSSIEEIDSAGEFWQGKLLNRDYKLHIFVLV
ncbi:hypothetical protein [Bacillus pseudomycoides]|nr:hypothetical protein [Bacillus pseudomycoides]